MNVILNKNRLYPRNSYANILIPNISSYNTQHSSTKTSYRISPHGLQYTSHTTYRPQAADPFIMATRWTNTERDSSV